MEILKTMLPMAAAVIGFCLCTCPITAPSISLEGKYLWILRESPIEESSLLWVKVGFQLLLTLPRTVIANISVSIEHDRTKRTGTAAGRKMKGWAVNTE